MICAEMHSWPGYRSHFRGASRNYITNDLRRMDAREFVIQSAVEISQSPVVESHLVQDGGVEIPNVSAVHSSLVPKLIRFAVR